MKTYIYKITRACPKQGPALPAIFSTTTRRDRTKPSVIKRLKKCTMQNERRVARARAHGDSPVLLSACGCEAIFSSEQRGMILCKQTSGQEMNRCDRLLNQQPILLQKKEQRNGEANNFDLKSCSVDWVHLKWYWPIWFAAHKKRCRSYTCSPHS